MIIPIILILFFVGLVKVNAETYLQTTTINFASTDTATQHDVFTSTNTFKNFGRGYLTFNFVYYRASDTTSFQVPSAKEVQVTAGSNIYVCELGTFSQDFDSNYDNLKMNFYTAVCDVNLQSEGLTKITIVNANGVNNQYTLKTSQYMTFSSNLEFEIRSYMATINSTLANYLGTINSTISGYIATTNDLTNRINNLLQTNIPLILNAITNSQTAIINNQNANHDEIMDEDIDATSKQNVDQTQYNDYKSKENQLMGFTSENNLSSLNIGIDANTSETIWQLITRIIQSNAKVFGLFISILSIGIIKIALAR